MIKVGSNDELKEIDIKSCTCDYLGDIIKIKDFDFIAWKIISKFLLW